MIVTFVKSDISSLSLFLIDSHLSGSVRGHVTEKYGTLRNFFNSYAYSGQYIVEG